MNVFSRTCAGALASALLSMAATTASAGPHHLTGDYAYTGEGSCLYSPQGFDPVLLTPLGFSFVSSFSVTGTWTWYRNGKASLVGRIVSFNHSPSYAGTTFTPAASSATLKASFTSGEEAEDGSFAVDMTSFLGKFTAGSRTGQTFTSGSARVVTFASQNGKTLTMATTEPAIDVQTIFDRYGNPAQSIPRICHATRTLVRVAS